MKIAFHFILAVLVCLGMAMGTAVPALADTTVPVEFFDQENVLDQNLIPQGLDHSQLTLKIAVLTVDAPSVRKDSYDADVKRYVLTHPECASIVNSRGDDLDANVILISLSTRERMIGVYGGSGVPRIDEVKKQTIDSMRSLAQGSQWSSAVRAGAQSAIRAANADRHFDFKAIFP